MSQNGYGCSLRNGMTVFFFFFFFFFLFASLYDMWLRGEKHKSLQAQRARRKRGPNRRPWRQLQALSVPISLTVPTSMPYFLMTLRSCNMSNSTVASLPAKSMIAFFPPGWGDRKSVTSYTTPPTMHQQSVSVLCFSTSSAVSDMGCTGDGWIQTLSQNGYGP
uniref:Uncharacterized protein n=1 Tax=Prorocentrum micans TaxID=2945 RepID=A0A7S2TBW4_PROMC